MQEFFVTNKIFLGLTFFSTKFVVSTQFLFVKLQSNFKVEMTLFYPLTKRTRTTPNKIFKNEVYNRLEIWNKNLTHKIKTSPTIPGMVTHHPEVAHPPPKDSQPSNSTRSLTLAQPSLFPPCYLREFFIELH